MVGSSCTPLSKKGATTEATEVIEQPSKPIEPVELSYLFSLLEAMFGKDQDGALGELLQAAMMLRYNKRSVA